LRRNKMAKYQVGDKVVLNSDLEYGLNWMCVAPVIISGICNEGGNNEHYTIKPSYPNIKDLSWVADEEIDHEATNLLK